jgi:glycogen synthase
VRPPEHILMTADAVGGVWMYSLELARALAAAGTRVTLATMGPRPTNDQRAQALLIPQLTLVESDFKLEWMNRPWDDVDAAGTWLLELADELRPDLIHLNGFAHGALQWNAPCVVVAHSCVVSWWNAVLFSEPPTDWSHYRHRVRAGLLGADAVAAVSRAMADVLARHYAFAAADVVHNGRWSPEYLPGRKEHFILTSGRAWDQAKNVLALDRVAPQLRWPVRLAGETQRPHGGDVELRRLQALGKLSPEELRPWFSRASIYALPALYEPFGLSVLEAALSGCALVLGDIPSLREIWDGAAMFVNPRDDGAIAAALNRLADDGAVRLELARKARVRGLSLTPERMVKGYLGVYSQARTRYGAAREVAASCAS